MNEVSGHFACIVYILAACAIYSVEEKNFVLAVGVPDEIAENGSNAGCCVGDEDNCGDRSADKLGYCFTGLV
jgi:hypothetical protein